MLRSIWTSKTGLDANQDRLDLISNNLANTTTTGYKKLDLSFKDLLSESLDRKGYPLQDKSAIMGTGARTTDWFRSNKQGNLTSTGLNTDLCIDGENHYFRLTTPTGQKVYTRDGSFQIDSAGKLVDAYGNRLDIEYNPGYENTFLASDKMTINEEGYIYLTENNGISTQIGKINLYTAIGDKAFISNGDSTFVPAENATVYQSGEANIHQGYIEASNVDMAQEFTDMIVTQRAFQLSTKALQTANDMWGMINNIR